MLRPLAALPTAVAALAVALCLSAPAVAADGSPVPAAVSLIHGWRFAPDPGDRGLAAGWQTQAGGAHAPWHDVSLPHVFDPRPLKREFHGTVGWYELDFTAPPRRAGFSWGIRFEQARRVATVWLNGRRLGTHRDPYVPFMLPLSGLKPGRNHLVVRLDNRKGKEPREGWWNWGGLTRAVSLVPRGPLELRDPGVMPQVACGDGGARCAGSVLVDGTLVNRSGAPAPDAQVRVTLQPPDGSAPIVHTEPVRPLAPGEQARVTFRVDVPDPQLWSPEHPQLYTTEVQTLDGGRPVQVDRLRTGMRGVAVVDGMLELNGRQLDLRGAAIQEDMRGRGPALTDADIREIVRELQAVHANVTRAHYLLDPRLLDALDRAGIMVWSQAPIYHRDRLLETDAQRAFALSTLRGTVLAARSHASVITNSVANELSVIPDETPGTRAYLDAALRETRDLDPTRPVSVDLLSYPGYPVQKTYAQYDLLGINSYFGWYPGKKAHSTANLADLGPFLDRMRDMYPRQALMLTEFGAESTFHGPPTEKETYAFQSRYVKDVLDAVERRPFVSGAIYWTLREFAVKPDWDGGAKRPVRRDSIHHKGLISYAGHRKPAWGVAEREFASTPLYREVSPAAAANLPEGRGGGSPLLVWAVVLAVLGLLGLDVWALRGILRARRARSAAARAAARRGDRPGDAAPARAA